MLKLRHHVHICGTAETVSGLQADIMGAIAAKMDRYRNPWQELRLQYGANKGKAYTGGHCSPQL